MYYICEKTPKTINNILLFRFAYEDYDWQLYIDWYTIQNPSLINLEDAGQRLLFSHPED